MDFLKSRPSSNSSFMTKQFIKHIHLFMESLRLIPVEKSVVVAVSGGVDSIVLMYILHDIFNGNIQVVHINHGTRPNNSGGSGNSADEDLVKKHCKILNVKLDIENFSLDLSQKNFEAIARDLRSEVYKKYLDNNFWVYTAHHLDDSFEWSMIQSFKQSSLASTLGIPVFNKGIVRPLMCVSKNQIVSFAKALNLVWLEDLSNNNTRFERNYFRANLTKNVYNRYPQYLSHYVARQNQLALKLNLHRSLFLSNSAKSKSDLYEKRESSGAVVLQSTNFSFHKNQIIEWIYFFSKTHRGEINREVDKLILAHQNIINDPKALKMKGPLAFSGGVKIFILEDCLFICNDLHLHYYRRSDELLLNYLNLNHKVTQIPKEGTNQNENNFFPYLCLLGLKDKANSSKLIHPLLPKSSEWLKSQNIPYSFYPLISKKVKQNRILNAVILDSSVLGL